MINLEDSYRLMIVKYIILVVISVLSLFKLIRIFL
nr:MAG TPA_asm: hypothetical protein [Caudoviricetes sp.]